MICTPKLLCGLVSLLVAVRSSCNKKTRGLRDDGAATRRGTGLRNLSDCTHKPEITPTARFRHWGTHTGPAPSTRPRAWRAGAGAGRGRRFQRPLGRLGWPPRPSDSPGTQGRPWGRRGWSGVRPGARAVAGFAIRRFCLIGNQHATSHDHGKGDVGTRQRCLSAPIVRIELLIVIRE